MNQRQDNKVSNNTIQGNLYFSPTQNFYNNGPEDPLSNKSDKEKAVHYNAEGNAKIGISDKDAIEDFQKSIACDPSLPLPHIGLGTIAYRQNSLNLALVHFKKAESLYENFPALTVQRQEVTKLIQKISDQINSKQKKPWFIRFF